MDRVTPLSADRRDTADDVETTTRTPKRRVLTAATASSAASPVGNASTAPRLPSYQLRRQEMYALSEEIRLLEGQLDEMRHCVGLPTQADAAAVDAKRAKSAALDEAVHVHDLYLSRLHSMATNELLEPPVNPLATYIHLPHDMAQRRAILRGIYDVKLRRGIECLTERLHHLDHTQPYLSEERFTTASGEYHYARHEIHQFPNFQTARQLFDTFVNFLYNMEISVTEGLGQMALREDTEEFDPTIWNHRIVTVTDDVGCTEELNLVGFAGFDDHSSATASPLGIVVMDVANADDLYPYLPAERTCKDVQTAHMAYELRKPGTVNETIVVFKQCYFMVQLPPQFELEPQALAQLQHNCSRWPDFIVKYLRDYVVADTDRR